MKKEHVDLDCLSKNFWTYVWDHGFFRCVLLLCVSLWTSAAAMALLLGNPQFLSALIKLGVFLVLATLAALILLWVHVRLQRRAAIRYLIRFGKIVILFQGRDKPEIVEEAEREQLMILAALERGNGRLWLEERPDQ